MDYIKGAATVMALLVALVILLDKLWSARRSSHTPNGVNNASGQSDSVDPLPLPIGEYEVFLSFRGPDTRYQITDILYRFLVHLKVRTFKDDDELRKGEEIWPSLVKAIEQSKIYVPIFSENYAYSKWCLRELAEMVKHQEPSNGSIILPIFYMGDPGDVRHQSGPYENAFQQHEQVCDEKTVASWKQALETVGALKGWHVRSNDEQTAIADKVSSAIWSHLMKSHLVIETGKLFGVDDHVEIVMDKLSLHSGDARIVGIHGIPGVGKTTIATAVYNKICTEFERCSFVGDVRETLQQKDGIISLQKKLISNILRMDSVYIGNASEGIRIIRDRISHVKALIVLDDVDEGFKFDNILGNIDNFIAGSRFVITSRNKYVLLTVTEECKLYEVQEMNHPLSLQLFYYHAFREESPPPGYESLSDDIVSTTGGLPLALEVIGSSLFKRDKPFWGNKLALLREIPEKDVFRRLKISYDTLDDQAKDIFLDVACFFIGWNKELPSYMWDDCKFFPATYIQILTERSLIKFGDRNQLQMHDQLKYMGREIVRLENKKLPWDRSRIWSSKTALDMLLDKKGASRVECITMNSSSRDGVVEELGNECFMNLSQLRYLEAGDTKLIGEFCNHLSNLRWLRCKVKTDDVLPNFCMKNMVILEIRNGVKDDYGALRRIKMANKLKVLILSGRYLARFPDLPLSGSLEILHLWSFSHCLSPNDLDIGNLRNLKVLSLVSCEVREIKGGTIGMLKGLRELKILSCRVERDPSIALADIGELLSLEILKVTVKDGTGSYFQNVMSWVKLPTSSKELDTPSPVANLPELLELEVLAVESCRYGLQIPLAGSSSSSSSMWWKVSKLKSLTLSSSLITIPMNTSLALLPSSLTSISLFYSSMHWFPNLENLVNLTSLFIVECNYLEEIRGLGGLKSLQTLKLYTMASLSSLDGLDSLHSLTNLHIFFCDSLERLPSIASLSKLLELDISRCPRLTEIPGLGILLSVNMLQSLSLMYCHLLTSQSFDDLDDDCQFRGGHNSLRLLSIGGTMSLVQTFCRMLQVSRFPGLAELKLEGGGIDNVDTELGLEWVEAMEELVELSLLGLPSLQSLPSLSRLSKLENLTVTDAPNLQEIEGLAGLNSLQCLKLKGCTALKRLSAEQLSGLKQLKSLHISGCFNLTDPSTLRRLEPNVEIPWPDYTPSSSVS